MLTLVGAGRIGTALAGLATANDVEYLLVGRDHAGLIGEHDAGPIVVCTRNDDVAAVVQHCARPDDLVFIQNGAMRPWLAARGLGDCTQGVLYFAVPKLRAPPESGGESVFFGRHASGLVYLLRRGNLAARVVADDDELRTEIAYKLLWAAIFGLLGDLHQETVLASVARAREVAALVTELAPVCEAGLGAPVVADQATKRLLAYSRAIGSWRASAKEWPWRNGWLIECARRHALATPLHDSLVAGWRQAGGVY